MLYLWWEFTCSEAAAHLVQTTCEEGRCKHFLRAVALSDTSRNTWLNPPWQQRLAGPSVLPTMCQSFPCRHPLLRWRGRIKQGSATRPPAVWAETEANRLLADELICRHLFCQFNLLQFIPFPVALTAGRATEFKLLTRLHQRLMGKLERKHSGCVWIVFTSETYCMMTEPSRLLVKV